MKQGVIIQARTGSSRLPNKVLTPFYKDENLLDILLGSLQKFSNGRYRVILATTENPKDEALLSVARKWGVDCFKGSEADVLDRFIAAARQYDVDSIIRICSDNPFLQVSAIDTLFDEYEKTGADYVSFAFPDGLPVIKSHLGLFMELTTRETLQRVREMTDEPVFHEHVTNYIYAHPETFSVRLLELPPKLQNRKDLRFTLDTQDDFRMLQALYADFRNTDMCVDSLLHIVDSHSRYRDVMKENIKKNQK